MGSNRWQVQDVPGLVTLHMLRVLNNVYHPNIYKERKETKSLECHTFGQWSTLRPLLSWAPYWTLIEARGEI